MIVCSVLTDNRQRSGTRFSLSCLLSHARSSAVSKESRSLSRCTRTLAESLQMQDLWKVHVIYPISTDVIKPALRLRVARGHPGTRTYVQYIDRGHVEFDRRGSRARARPPSVTAWVRCLSEKFFKLQSGDIGMV